jgi:F0F1-type ATP synthase assembly protein I
MEKLGYILIGSVVLLWCIGILAGIILVFPYGIIGLVLIVGFGLLFAKVLKERLASKEDDYYSKNIDK